MFVSVTVPAGEIDLRPAAAGARCGGEARTMMDSSRAWTKLFAMYTDGHNVWAMRDDKLAASKPIGQDVDGYLAALDDTVAAVAREASEAVRS